jgi:uncharacterized protein YbaP (TraB family)
MMFSGPRRTRRAALLAGAAALALTACTKESATATPPQTPAADAAPAEKGPAMWRLADEDSEIFLFGTFHILPADIAWTTAAFDEAMAATATTVTEVDTRSAAAQAKMAALVQKLGLNPAGVTLSSTLGSDRAERFGRLAGQYGLQMQSLESLKPWLAMITLSVMVMQKEGFEAASGAEETILARAKREGDAVTHLESAEYQIRALASLDEAEILADFDASLEQFADFKAYSERVLGAWRTGDVAALERETLVSMRDSAPGAFDILITARNRNWTREIDALMQGDSDYFIAVGAGHLIGEGSVVDMLAAKGYAVARVQ